MLHLQLSPYLSHAHRASQDVVLRRGRTYMAALLSGSVHQHIAESSRFRTEGYKEDLCSCISANLLFSLTGFLTVTPAILASGDCFYLKAPEGVIELCTIALPSSDVLFTFIPAYGAGRALKVACGLYACARDALRSEVRPLTTTHRLLIW